MKIDPKYIKIPNRYDFAYILNNGDTRLNSFENAVREILQDELQCVDSIMNYIYFMMNVLNEHNKGARMVVFHVLARNKLDVLFDVELLNLNIQFLSKLSFKNMSK